MPSGGWWSFSWIGLELNHVDAGPFGMGQGWILMLFVFS